ncbi:YbdD/YjiX family protein [Mobilicoccus pelagius]|uniref:DUF466 domain-containing protein n=1 Tax=Mobilicoccus pelagius NBRC 104925 TaxID=1089455 RepID=H5US11_9MICO|nr:YbdD/YjiX family protein [Mobilicoccus pelagius]GAB48519.1 hypothetical protein MOPEL_074_00060 [Mobilicoccus pelagius NBRC 104925]
MADVATGTTLAARTQALTGRVRAAGRLAWATWRSILGADRYDRYLAHHRVAHPDVEPMGEKEFWREHYRSLDRDPGARCC